jgi:hypothetical protein
MAFDSLDLNIPDELWVPTLNNSLDSGKLNRLKKRVLMDVYGK